MSYQVPRCIINIADQLRTRYRFNRIACAVIRCRVRFLTVRRRRFISTKPCRRVACAFEALPSHPRAVPTKSGGRYFSTLWSNPPIGRPTDQWCRRTLCPAPPPVRSSQAKAFYPRVRLRLRFAVHRLRDGVLCTLSAWGMFLSLSCRGLEPGRKLQLPLGLLF
jgi:hypothetical protein